MKTLEEIKSFAKEHKACIPQYSKFIEFINNGDELSAWQTVLGNIDWLQDEGLDIYINDVITKANGIAKTWHDNGKLCREYHVNENGEYNGLFRRWWSNGQLFIECSYKNDEHDGLYHRWYSNGKLWEEGMYINDVKIK